MFGLLTKVLSVAEKSSNAAGGAAADAAADAPTALCDVASSPVNLFFKPYVFSHFGMYLATDAHTKEGMYSSSSRHT